MKEDYNIYVAEEITKLARTKGFIPYIETCDTEGRYHTDFPKSPYFETGYVSFPDRVFLPTLEEVCNWLRNEHSLHVWANYVDLRSGWLANVIGIYSKTDTIKHWRGSVRKNYADAILEGIHIAIELI